MSITDTVSQAAAKDPAVGMTVASANTKSAILAGIQTGDTSFGNTLGAVSAEALEAIRMLSSLTPTLGQNLDIRA